MTADIVTRLMIGAQVEAGTVIAIIEQLQTERDAAYARGLAAGLEAAAGVCGDRIHQHKLESNSLMPGTREVMHRGEWIREAARCRDAIRALAADAKEQR